MENNKFIDRYFESEAEILNIKHSEKRTMNSFITYLENLHSVGDKLKNKFNCNIKNTPEFIVLRIIRNYFHHVDDIEEYSMAVEIEDFGIYEYNRHLIISLKDFSKSLKNFINNTKNKNYIGKQIKIINMLVEDDIIKNIDKFCNMPNILINDEEYELGFDTFKYVYNISNIIADKCRDIDSLKSKFIIQNLEATYTLDYNIPKKDLLCAPENIPILTTEGFIYPKKTWNYKIDIK